MSKMANMKHAKTNMNRKVNVDTEDDRRWQLSPHLLTAVKVVNESPAQAKPPLRNNEKRR